MASLEHRPVLAPGPEPSVASVAARWWPLVVLVGSALILVLGALAVHLAPPDTHVAAWWPGAGVGVAMLVTVPWRHRLWPLLGIAVASLLANRIGGRPWDVSLGFVVVNVAEALVVVLVLTRAGQARARLQDLADLGRLILAALLGAVVAGGLAGLTVSTLQDANLWVSWRAIIASHGAAVMIIAPLALQAPDQLRTGRRWELALQWVALTGCILFVFSPEQNLPMSFLPLPLLIWGAVRQSPRMVSLQLLVAGVLTSLLTTEGNGPFVTIVETYDYPPEMVGTLLQFLLLAFASVTLPLALSLAQNRAALAELDASLDLLHSILDGASGTFISGVDVNGTVVLFNAGGENMLGYTAEEVVGKTTPVLWHDPAEVRARAAELGVEPGMAVFTDRVDAGEGSEQRDWTFVRKDGSRLTVSLRVAPRRMPDGRIIGYMGVAEDVTERRLQEAQLRAAVEREREAVEQLALLDRAKSDFVASVSHELRTPITSVLGYTELLDGGSLGPVTDGQHAVITRISRSSRRLLTLIEELLTLGRIEEGRLDIRRDEVDLGDVVASAREALEHQLAGRGVAVSFSVPEEDVTVLGDERQLERVVVNLLGNAVKFTPDGGSVGLTVDVVEGRARLSVTDSGIGIPEDELPRLFERFFRSRISQERAIKGTGIGLWMVKQIVAAHGGSIELTSRVGEGTTVCVDLPLASVLSAR
ncbi:MAG TPA: ATP-binding protein [Nocardioidaceae bacterium]|nr:ATP-binding protein [Nocardioidaceae bacterium]